MTERRVVRSSRHVWFVVATALNLGAAGCRWPGSKDASPPPVAATSAALAHVGDAAIGEGDLSPGVRAQLAELELARYGVLAKEVSALVDRRVIEKAASAAGMEAGALLKQEVDRRAPDPTPDEIAQALTQPEYAEPLARLVATLDASPPADGKEPATAAEDRARVRAKREAAMREQVADRARQALRPGRQARARAALVKAWRKQFGVTVNVHGPAVPRLDPGAEGWVALGSAAAPGAARLHLFLDPTDATSVRVLQEANVQLAAGDLTPTLFVTYLARGARADAGVYAEALQCAAGAGHGAAFHAALFATAQVPGTEKLAEVAARAGLDSPAFAACLQNHTQRERVERATQAARAIGVTRAPVLLVNGIRLTAEQTGLIRSLVRDDRSSA